MARVRDTAPRERSRPRSGAGGGLPLGEAFATEDWPALRGSKRDGGIFATLGASGAGFDARVWVSVAARRGRRVENCYALGLAGFAALGLILELLIVEEQLFAGGEDKFRAAIDTGQ
jgi:hypothetical protein